MNRRRYEKFCAGQSLLDYVLLIGIVSMVLFSMNNLIRRSIQAVVKGAADHIGNQEEAEQDFEGRGGYLVSSFTDSRSSSSKSTDDYSSTVFTFSNGTTDTVTNSLTNLGLVEGTD